MSDPETEDDDYGACADQVLTALQSTVPGKRWKEEDIVHAHRLGEKRTGYNRRPRPMFVKFSRWRDKMDVLTKGREKLQKKGINVAGDLTSKQQKTVQGYRERGIRAYYKGNQLVVAGPLKYHPLNRGTFAEAVRRRVDSGIMKDRRTDSSRQQGWSNTSRDHQNSTGRTEHFHMYPHGYTEHASAHQWDSSWIPFSGQEDPDLERRYWNEGDQWNYESSPYNWQYYSSWQDSTSYPQSHRHPRNMENLIPVSTKDMTDDPMAVAMQGPGLPSRPSSGSPASARDCRVGGSQSVGHSTSPVDKAARDCRVSGSQSARDSTSPVDRHDRTCIW
eukprot:TRINITY_DN56884_c0_g1_i13.p1 TRINITY_DN56884_c0_g1~~TRINITY_DN56884_c0_g1_i13.p1  ORF type:complete len:332 (+),score=78.11 TRINITY_DN56884_c0_g1_i13:1297-2292(+)